MQIRVRRLGKHTFRPTFPQNLKKGDVLAIYSKGRKPIIPYDGRECWTRRGLYSKSTSRQGAPTVGSVRTFTTLPSGSMPCRNYSLYITLVKGEI